MTVYRKNISINVGETFSEDLTLLSADGSGVVDLTGFTAQSKIRKVHKIIGLQIYKLELLIHLKVKLIFLLLVQ